MDEEGTVVYFETSPALQGEDKLFASELSFTEAGPKEESFASTTAPQFGNGIWKLYSYVVTRFRGIIPDHFHERVECRHCIAGVIRDSPLLTEEDYQLLYFVLLKPHPHQTVTHDQPLGITLKCAVAVVMVALFAVCATHLRYTALLACTLSVVLLLCAGTLLLYARHERSLLSARKAVSDYLTETEALLALLSHCLRTIQEAEIVSRGYSRPSGSVPVSRMEGGSTSYQCVALRRGLFSVCQTVLSRLRNTVVTLCQQYPLRGDLVDDVTSYLAHTSLDSLHTHITTTLDTISKEDAEKHKCLSLESLKDAANLLAVQNSELLRHLALAVLSTPGRETALPLNRLAGVLQAVEREVSEARQELQWSCDFHKNHLFGQPPSRPDNSQSVIGTTFPVAGLASEIHCMDLKTQAALQRIRDLGTQLATAQDTEALTSIKMYREQLTAALCIIDAVSDHIEDSLSVLHTLEHPGTQDTHKGVTNEESSVEDEAAEEPTTCPQELQHQDSCSSEDEMVFEAYVPAMRDNKEAETDSRWRVEGEVVTGREVSVNMVRELESVLAVRSEKREKRREEKRRRRREQGEESRSGREDRDTSTSEQQYMVNSESLPPPQETCTTCDAMTLILHSSTEQVSEEEIKLPNMWASDTEPEDHTLPNVNPDQRGHSSKLLDTTTGVPLGSQLAATVAAVAARRRRTADIEETYGSDSSHSE